MLYMALVAVEKTKGHWVKTFLLSDRQNNNGWQVTWESIKKNVRDFIGRPGITYEKCVGGECDLDHTNATSYANNLRIQEQYRASTIVEVELDEASHTAYALHEVHDKQLQKDLESGRVGYVSPSVWPVGMELPTPDRPGPPGVLLTDWRAVHLAWVTKPAYGPSAQVVSQCEGGKECIFKMSQPKSASEGTANSDNISNLQQVPLLVRHNGKLTYTAASDCVQREIRKKVDEGLEITDKQIAIAYSICGESKKGMTASCTKCEKTEKLRDDITRLRLKVAQKSLAD